MTNKIQNIEAAKALNNEVKSLVEDWQQERQKQVYLTVDVLEKYINKLEELVKLTNL
jgi:hypothetical protein